MSIRVLCLLLAMLVGCASTPTVKPEAKPVGLRAKIPDRQMQEIQSQLIELIRSSGFERNSTPMAERWDKYLQGPHLLIALPEPTTIQFPSSSRTPVVATQILYPVSRDRCGPYILARDGDKVRAFAMYDQKLASSLNRTLQPYVW